MDDKTYGEDALNPLIPIHYCNHDPLDKDVEEFLCTECKTSVKVSFKINYKSCIKLGKGGEKIPNKKEKIEGKQNGVFPFNAESSSFVERVSSCLFIVILIMYEY